jgi:hypothetical protein
MAAKGHLTRSNRGVAWSPDNQWVAYIGLRGTVAMSITCSSAPSRTNASDLPSGDSLTGKDSQLDIAVQELIKQLGSRTTSSLEGGRER